MTKVGSSLEPLLQIKIPTSGNFGQKWGTQVGERTVDGIDGLGAGMNRIALPRCQQQIPPCSLSLARRNDKAGLSLAQVLRRSKSPLLAHTTREKWGTRRRVPADCIDPD